MSLSSLIATAGPGPAPVEYAVAVDRYLDSATLGAASRRVYRISLTGWAWPLVDRDRPAGAGRRRAAPPIVPLALLDRPEAAARLAAATAARAAVAGARTVNRELSALRSAVGWWQDQGWITADPTAGLRHLTRPARPPLTLGPARARQPAPRPRGPARAHVLAPAGRHRRTGRGDPGPGRRPPGPGQPPHPARRVRGPALDPSHQRAARLAARGPLPRPGVPHRAPRPGRHPARRRLPANRPRPDVLPPRRGDLHHGNSPPGPGRPRLDPPPAPWPSPAGGVTCTSRYGGPGVTGVIGSRLSSAS